MKVKVINLPQREDRRNWFTETNQEALTDFNWEFVDAVEGNGLTYEDLQRMDFDTDKNWRDPLLKRTLTKGEVGCFLSHYKLWEECAEGEEPYLILEDDAFLKEAPKYEWIDGDLTDLTHKEMLPDGVVGKQVCYAYWTAAYILTPRGAQTLLDTDIDKNLIPVDEYLPRMTDRVKMTSVDKAGQTNRSGLGTDVEPRSHQSFLIDFSVHNLTCHDSDQKAGKLLATNPDVVNILNEEWKGGTMEGPGGGQKLNCLRQYIEDLPDHDVVVFTDGFDVFWTRSLDEVVGRWLEMKSEVVFAAEKYLWPNKHLRFPPCATPYRYLNSGCFIGRVGELKRILQTPLYDSADDQLYIHHRFLSGLFSIKLDYEQYIFMTNEDRVEIRSNNVYNPETKCFGCVYHGNGGDTAKRKFKALFSAQYPELTYANLEVKDYKVIGNEMLLVDFMTPSQCEEWIKIGNENGSWTPHEADKFPSHDIHLKTLGLWDEMDGWWNKVAARVFEDYWKPTHNHHLRKAFLMKYSADTQKTLGLHNDASQITGSVKLNEDYEGATLIFPRQDVTNKDIPIGKMIIFPSMVTHGHFVDELKSGIKYSLTCWSARFKGEYLDP